MGATQSKNTKLEEVVVAEETGATAPTNLNGPGLPMVGGKRKKSGKSKKSKKSRKSRKVHKSRKNSQK